MAQAKRSTGGRGRRALVTIAAVVMVGAVVAGVYAVGYHRASDSYAPIGLNTVQVQSRVEALYMNSVQTALHPDVPLATSGLAPEFAAQLKQNPHALFCFDGVPGFYRAEYPSNVRGDGTLDVDLNESADTSNDSTHHVARIQYELTRHGAVYDVTLTGVACLR